MKTYASIGVLAVLGAGALALGSGCTVNDSDDDDVVATSGASSGGASGSTDSSTTATSGSTGSASGDDSSTSATSGSTGSATGDDDSAAPTGDETGDSNVFVSADAAGDGAASCGSFTTGAAACDACVQAQCCDTAAACDLPDDAGLDDAGLSACEQLVSCVTDLCSDGGSLTDCLGTCSPPNGLYSVAETSAASALLTCVTTNCAQSCK